MLLALTGQDPVGAIPIKSTHGVYNPDIVIITTPDSVEDTFTATNHETNEKYLTYGVN